MPRPMNWWSSPLRIPQYLTALDVSQSICDDPYAPVSSPALSYTNDSDGVKMDVSTLEAGGVARDTKTEDECDDDDDTSNVSSTDTLIASQQLAEQDRRSRVETWTTVLLVM